FGLAKLTEQKSASDDQGLTVTNTQHTQAGLVLGTPRYMSPEQARGQPADARSDIWSLGAVIYEMVSGVPAFSGATPSDCIASILKTEASPLSRVAPAAPPELQSVLHKALRKNRDERYQTIADMLADLRSLKEKLERAASAPKFQPAWLWSAAVSAIVLIAIGALFFTRYRSLPVAARATSSSVPDGTALSAPANIPEKSIAVLPFENRSHDPDNAYFADAIQDEILTRLSRIADLKVISRTSTQHYKTVPANVPDIAKQLGVAHVLEGSVQKSGDAVRVNVQLIKAANDSHVWADTFDRKLTDILSVESEVAKAIAEQLRATLTGQEEQLIAAKPTRNPDAYVFYLRANQISRNPDTLLEDYKTAEQLYMQAIELDPNFALAHGRLASVCAEVFRYYEPTDSWRTKARAEAEAAIRLQPNLAEGHFALGQCIYWMDQDYDKALEQFKVASRLSPSNADTRRLIAAIERRQGKWQQALERYERVAKIDPQNPNTVRELINTNTSMRRWPEAASWAERMRAMAPMSFVAKSQRGYIEFWWKADARLLKSTLDQMPAGVDPDGSVTAARWDVAM